MSVIDIRHFPADEAYPAREANILCGGSGFQVANSSCAVSLVIVTHSSVRFTLIYTPKVRFLALHGERLVAWGIWWPTFYMFPSQLPGNSGGRRRLPCQFFVQDEHSQALFSRVILQIEEYSAAYLPSKSVHYLLVELHVRIRSCCPGGLAVSVSLHHFSVSCTYLRLSLF